MTGVPGCEDFALKRTNASSITAPSGRERFSRTVRCPNSAMTAAEPSRGTSRTGSKRRRPGGTLTGEEASSARAAAATTAAKTETMTWRIANLSSGETLGIEGGFARTDQVAQPGDGSPDGEDAFRTVDCR